MDMIFHTQPFGRCDDCSDGSSIADHDRASGQTSPLANPVVDVEQEAFSTATSAEATEAGWKAEALDYDHEERPSLEAALAALRASYAAVEAHANAAEQAVGTVDGAQRAAHHARMARHHTEQVSKHTTYLGDDADDSMEWMAYDLADSAVQDARKAQAAEFAGVGMTAPTAEHVEQLRQEWLAADAHIDTISVTITGHGADAAADAADAAADAFRAYDNARNAQ